MQNHNALMLFFFKYISHKIYITWKTNTNLITWNSHQYITQDIRNQPKNYPLFALFCTDFLIVLNFFFYVTHISEIEILLTFFTHQVCHQIFYFLFLLSLLFYGWTLKLLLLTTIIYPHHQYITLGTFWC